MKKTHLLSAVFALLLLLAGCDSARVFEENREMENSSWNMNQKLNFEFDIPDTQTPYNLYFNLRHTDDYPFANIYVFFHTTVPGGEISTDTVEFQLANPQTGAWLGKGQGELHDCQMRFRTGMKFTKAGHYKLEIEQAMRSEQLDGIKDAGFRIERAE
ncbi:MAG: gliding motility lipoprotein GldH [Bacteroidota bacterium]